MFSVKSVVVFFFFFGGGGGVGFMFHRTSIVPSNKMYIYPKCHFRVSFSAP